MNDVYNWNFHLPRKFPSLHIQFYNIEILLDQGKFYSTSLYFTDQEGQGHH